MWWGAALRRQLDERSMRAKRGNEGNLAVIFLR